MCLARLCGYPPPPLVVEVVGDLGFIVSSLPLPFRRRCAGQGSREEGFDWTAPAISSPGALRSLCFAWFISSDRNRTIRRVSSGINVVVRSLSSSFLPSVFFERGSWELDKGRQPLRQIGAKAKTVEHAASFAVGEPRGIFCVVQKITGLADPESRAEEVPDSV